MVEAAALARQIADRPTAARVSVEADSRAAERFAAAARLASTDARDATGDADESAHLAAKHAAREKWRGAAEA